MTLILCMMLTTWQCFSQQGPLVYDLNTRTIRTYDGKVYRPGSVKIKPSKYSTSVEIDWVLFKGSFE